MTTSPVLYGDGLHDDYAAIQAMLDSGACEVVLPVPKKEYVIGNTLKIHGGQTLRLPRFAVIRLAADVNRSMIEDCDFSVWKQNVCIDGGIWDMNSAEQEANPWHFAGKDGKTSYQRLNVTNPTEFKVYTQFPDVWTGFCMRFCRIRRFILKNVTFRNPVTYGVQMGYVEDFTVSDIIFDYTKGSPKLWNMDGVHLEGYCKNGVVRNLQGACHDDLVALTADDMLYGPIENVLIDGVFAEHSHSAVRILSHGYPVKNVTIRNVWGSYYVYCIGLTKYHGGDDERGVIENVTIENVSVCASEGTPDVEGGRDALVWVQKGVDVKNLRIVNLSRTESVRCVPTVGIDEGASVSGFVFKDVVLKNLTGKPVKILDNKGTISGLVEENVRED